VAPPLAAEMAGEQLTREDVLAAARAAVAGASQAEWDSAPRTLVIEGAGGLLSPLAGELTVSDLAAALGLPLLIAARPGLGTINHTLLTLQSARAAGLSVHAVVLTPWPEQPSRLESYNRETIARLGVVDVEVLGRAASAEIDELARVGGALPWRRWVGGRVAVAAAI
ncbi:MAG TPA: AAA family ATPase, partial [Solirubrobacteraceae bacterium]|nr:AAA family ATPase [Solirubrobacteraceae bacterium]